ncbi:hypothetical protein XELAEV_18022650mg [Xenopus laevis]|uniref:Protein kinase domain-containing protein n=1 Tax=Xenopus laevis TaxID=8355 RepID=A0A974HND0_XENLA|nr:hypothetical protein XELAEV_18022650mg [Xenopus laevis]
MTFCAPWRKPQVESRSLSEIYKPPDGQLTKDVLLGDGGTGDVYKGRHHRKGVVAVKIANISRDEESVCRELKFLKQFGGHKNIASYYGAYYRAPLTECSSELLEVRNDLLYGVHSSSYADQYPVLHLIREAQPPKLRSNRWSQHFVSFLESCLKKDPSERGSAEELLQHPFVTQLRPKKIIRVEIEEHLRTLPNGPAKKGLKGVALWTLRRASDFCTQTSAEQEAALQMALEGFSCY